MFDFFDNLLDSFILTPFFLILLPFFLAGLGLLIWGIKTVTDSEKFVKDAEKARERAAKEAAEKAAKEAAERARRAEEIAQRDAERRAQLAYFREKNEKYRLKEEEKMRQNIRRVGFWRLSHDGKNTNDREQALSLLSEIVTHSIIVDTNIWMDKDLEGFWYDFFNQCSQKKRKITVPSSVYDEVVRLKNSTDKAKSYGARLALSRFLKFSNSNLIDLVDLKKVADKKAYADLDIINMFEHIQQETKEVSLITNDVDLIIRIRHTLVRENEKNRKAAYKIYSVGRTEFSEEWNKLRQYLPKKKK